MNTDNKNEIVGRVVVEGDGTAKKKLGLII